MGDDKIKIELDYGELSLILSLLEDRVKYGDRVEFIRMCIVLIDKLGDILLEENSVNK